MPMNNALMSTMNCNTEISDFIHLIRIHFYSFACVGLAMINEFKYI